MEEIEAVQRARVAGYFLTVGYFLLGVAGLSIIPGEHAPARALIMVALLSWGLTYLGEMFLAYGMDRAALPVMVMMIILNIYALYAAVWLVTST